MFLSVFEIFKVGVGPSSSHTMGPMTAAGRFLEVLRGLPCAAAGVRVALHGSLAHTGVGHATDRATILGLAGFLPESYDAARAALVLAQIAATRQVMPPGMAPLRFDPAADLAFLRGQPLPGHANGMVFRATDAQGDVTAEETYYSIGGGFVLTAAELAAGDRRAAAPAAVPHPFASGAAMLAMAEASGLSVAQMKRANETCLRGADEIDAGLARIWQVMAACIDRGLAAEGVLPGGLGVRRRAGGLHRALEAERGLNAAAPHSVNDRIAAWAMAVSEENAAGGQVVTAPTNGAEGVVPAVIRYWLEMVPGAAPSRVGEFLLTAAAIGGLARHNASISGAECGCQAEVGSAAAMAAASLALRGDGRHLVSLDSCIETMRQTGRDMHEKYKETSLGGLAVNVPNC